MKNLGKERIFAAFKELDLGLKETLTLIMGGGGALVSVYNFPLATEDVDAFSVEKTLPSLDPLVKSVAKKLNLPPDWLNSYYSTFAAVLPKDYSKRLRPAFEGKQLKVLALGPEDLLIMKCFAGRDKDIPHSKALLKQKNINLEIVESRLEQLIEQKYPKALRARDFLDELTAES